jgi:hypothetical protein
VAEVRRPVIVESEVAIQRDLPLRRVREEPPTELHAPQLGEDRARQAFHEAIRPRMPAPGPLVAYVEVLTDLIEHPALFHCQQ